MHDHDYEMRVFWSEGDGYYLAEVPELPGCVADGATPEEAVTQARERIAEWIAFARELGRDVPQPAQSRRAIGAGLRPAVAAL